MGSHEWCGKSLALMWLVVNHRLRLIITTWHLITLGDQGIQAHTRKTVHTQDRQAHTSTDLVS